jgi:hypothetical protein
MLFLMRVMESIGLKVKKHTTLWIDNKGAVDLTNNWSIGDQTRRIEVWQYFLRDLKMDGIFLTQWLSGAEMSSDLFTKNLARPLFEQHTKMYSYGQVHEGLHSNSLGESVAGWYWESTRWRESRETLCETRRQREQMLMFYVRLNNFFKYISS